MYIKWTVKYIPIVRFKYMFIFTNNQPCSVGFLRFVFSFRMEEKAYIYGK
jgi:hypothetical protein